MGKKILDIGCTGSFPMADFDPEKTVHAKLALSARSCVGIDIRREAIMCMKNAGYSVVFGDAEIFDYPEKDFDVINLCEVIEHLSNPGLCLERCNKHLKIGGELIISTPNPTAFYQLICVLILNKGLQQHRGHVCLFTLDLISNILERYGFNVKEKIWLNSKGLLVRFRPNLSNSFLIIAEKKCETDYQSSLSITIPFQQA